MGLTETKKASTNPHFLTEDCFTSKKPSAVESPLQNHAPAQRFLSAETLSVQTLSLAVGPGAFVQVDWAQINCEECGSGPKAVLLLHEGVVNSAVWEDKWPAFCNQFHTN